jgi:LTXXQ motif family protein
MEGNIMNSHARFSLPALILMGAMAWMVPLGFAQTSAPPAQSVQDPHHPQALQGATPAPAPGAMPSESSQSGMMAGGTAQMMTMMRGMMAGRDAMMSSHVEGRIAFLKTELKITEAQIPQWTRLADALRSTTTSMNGMRQQMMQEGMPTSTLARLDLHEKMLSAHLDSLKSMKVALIPLYASFSDEQKKLADELMLGPMGMM